MTDDARPDAHLLVIDDDDMLRSMAARTLRHAGFQVSEAGCGEDGLALFDAQPYDLLLLDLMMPGLDGFAVCQRIRASEAGARVPILMLTGLNDTESIDQAYRHGATDFITKPINWALLSHRVRYALRASIAAESMHRGRESLVRAQRLADMGHWVQHPGGRVECSGELWRLFGASDAADRMASTDDLLVQVVPTDRDRVRQARELLASEGTPYQAEFTIRRGDGVLRTMFEHAVPIVDLRGRRAGSEGITQDITDRVQAQERIRQLAHYDATTGLPNRQFFADSAVPALALARRQGTLCAVLHVDIDRFKGVNDAFGRSRGDQVLRTLADRLRAWIRGNDLASSHSSADPGALARVGGNAFTLLITDLSSQEQAGVVAERLLKVVSQPIDNDGQPVVLTASIGITIFPIDGDDLSGLTRSAEQAAYAAKSEGRARCRFFDEKMNERASSRSLMETELRRAIVQGELLLHFQPQVDARCGRIVGVEALVRWQHPARGLVPPMEFIGLAEETGLILPLTDWVLEQACRTARDWRDAGLPGVPLSVNLAASSLTDAALVDKLDALMVRFDLRPACLTLEMTETMLMRDVESGIRMLDTLRARGYALSLDDFGTGYSSLSYLKRFAIRELKIDRSFVTDATSSRRDGTLASAIIALGRELGLHIVAEGVETAEQKAFLLRHGCSVQQGFLFSRPVPAAALAAMLGMPVGAATLIVPANATREPETPASVAVARP